MSILGGRTNHLIGPHRTLTDLNGPHWTSSGPDNAARRLSPRTATLRSCTSRAQARN